MMGLEPEISSDIVSNLSNEPWLRFNAGDFSVL
jgi:hypothetical protein